MRNRTDARDAHSFALEFSGGFDLRPDHYSLQPLVDDSRNHNGLAAVQRRAYQSISRRTGHLDIVGEERADSRRGSLTRDDHLRLDAVFAKQSLLLGNPNRAVESAYRAKAQPHLVLPHCFWRQKQDEGEK